MTRKNTTLRHLVYLAIQVLASLVDFRRGIYPHLRYKFTNYDAEFTHVDVLIINTNYDSLPRFATVHLEAIFSELECELDVDVNRVIEAILSAARLEATDICKQL